MTFHYVHVHYIQEILCVHLSIVVTITDHLVTLGKVNGHQGSNDSQSGLLSPQEILCVHLSIVVTITDHLVTLGTCE